MGRIAKSKGRHPAAHRPALKRELCRIALKLAESQELEPKLLSFFLSLLSLDWRRDFIIYIYGGRADFDNGSAIPSGEKIFGDYIGGKIAIGKSELQKRLVSLLAEEKSACPPDRGLHRRLSELKALFALSDGETRILSFLYCHSQCPELEAMCNLYPMQRFLGIVSDATGVPDKEVRKILSPSGRLYSNGMLEFSYSRQNGVVSLRLNIRHFLAGLETDLFGKRLLRADEGGVFDLGSFNASEHDISIAQALILSDSPCNIFIYGEPGTGKTEFARALAASCGRRAFFVMFNMPGSASSEHKAADRLLALKAAINICDQKDVMIVDEADFFLNTRYMFLADRETLEKGLLNNFLDNSKSKIIWIANEKRFIEESTLRRFSFSIAFKRFSRRERIAAWMNLVKGHPCGEVFSEEYVNYLACKYPVSAAGIASALETLKIYAGSEDCCAETTKDVLEHALERQIELSGAKIEYGHTQAVEQYGLEFLNTDADAERLIRELSNFLLHGSGCRRREGDNTNLLFWGAPGTGKTEFAKYFAGRLGLDILARRASDILNCYVGQTEKNIRAAFEEAGRDGAILLIDEADSFFVRRETAHRSWEATMTNELLTQMESHKGILICCTNLLCNLDRAALRRFHWKIEFKPLKDGIKAAAFERYFGVLSPQAPSRLSRIPGLTLGDIKAVWMRRRHSNARSLDENEIISELEREAKYRNEGKKGVGFGR